MNYLHNHTNEYNVQNEQLLFEVGAIRLLINNASRTLWQSMA
jgi:hypothetical protein